MSILNKLIILVTLSIVSCGHPPYTEKSVEGQKSFSQSIDVLKAKGIIAASTYGKRSSCQTAKIYPKTFGVHLIYMSLNGDKLNDLNLNTAVIAKSKLKNVSFQGSNLKRANLSLSEFKKVSFEKANLTRADLRSAKFINTSFEGADLSGADFRRASFKNVNFSNAKLDGTMMTGKQAQALKLSDTQKAAINWKTLDGPKVDCGCQ